MEADAHAQRLAAEAEALQGCEDEPIETIGTVQPFGALIALDSSLDVITHASANTADHLGLDAIDLLGCVPEEIFGQGLAHRMRNAAGLRTITTDREYLGLHTLGRASVDVTVHAVADAFIVEMQPAGAGLGGAQAFGLVRRAMAQIDLDTDVDRLLADSVGPLRDLAGFDRVMAYRFLPDGSGEIVAESRRADVESFLGLHFPAFDIPQSARRLYASTPIRVICDVEAEQFPILARSGDNTDLDLSLAVTRGCVEVHAQYLHNMGVEGSMSLPIVVEDELWGLFAFHHGMPRWLSSDLLMAAEIVGRTLSLGIEKQVRRARWEMAERSADLVAALLAEDDGAAGLGVGWSTLSAELLDALDCDGVALSAAGQAYTAGACPEPAVVTHLREALTDGASVMAVDDLRRRFPSVDVGGSAGVLLINSGGPAPLSVLFFRNAAEHSIDWAGSPSKDIVEVDGQLRLQPRSSFAAYVESVADRSLPWETSEVLAAEGMHAALASAMRIRRAAHVHSERMGLVVRELNHRVRNVLALVQSLAIQTRTTAGDLDEYSTGLEERLGALATTHDLLTEEEWGRIDFEVLVRRTGAAFIAGRGHAVRLTGPTVTIEAPVASLLSLLFHELFSNAARHGSLSVDRGTVDVTWRLEAGDFVVGWRERGGPPPAPPSRRGFGSVIIEEAIPFELAGRSTFELAATGAEVEIAFPERMVRAGSMTIEPAAGQLASESGLRLPPTVLVVEDDFLVSRETVRLLETLGAHEVLAVANVEQAIDILDRTVVGLGLLDVNLQGSSSLPVARRLAANGTPFVFLTGYGADAELEEFDAPVVAKPVTADRLRDALAGVLVR